ncbi:MAG: class I SAM-dependent methyltransferase [Melioribacteraceae bacterium]|nr:class I SAM-dependent methyltransferase [Melioribacteraceae bacterium]MCF8356471.1 class I SAM-dependent methyltransferase [Melioribacteraceae bacterium]MCF8393383.1 class I SAM-dependent methyltransferase [Melioribacteraceae bacterium]MCF8418948.1 class I SAM-dependent methyltransferase [Melioribacteraceae bacterium]
MKVRDSAMPNEDMWNSFFDPPEILSKLKLNKEVKDAVEFGSGYGTFSIPASLIINGNLYAIDIESEMIGLLKKKMSAQEIANIKLLHKDFMKEGTGLADNSVDYVMLFNILHTEKPEKLLSETYRILAIGGKAAVIHWIYSADTPRGPSLEIRPTPEMCIRWLTNSGFSLNNEIIDLPPYHYGLIGVKT